MIMGKFSKEKIQECAEWVRENGLMEYGGARLKDFCTHFNIDDMTYYGWMRKTEFSEAIKKAKDYFKNNIEHDIVISLAKAAKGYEYEEVKTEYQDVDGKPQIKRQTKTRKHVEPNVGAAIFLLTNIAPQTWQNKQRQDVEIKRDDANDIPRESIIKELERLEGIDGK